MPNDTPPDMSAQFQQWVTQWERAADEFSNKVMGTDEFSKSINKVQGMQMEFQRSFGELMAKQLANMNMPSREDVLRIGEDLQKIDRRLAHIERSMDKVLKQGDPKEKKKAGPARTKTPPATEA